MSIWLPSACGREASSRPRCRWRNVAEDESREPRVGGALCQSPAAAAAASFSHQKENASLPKSTMGSDVGLFQIIVLWCAFAASLITTPIAINCEILILCDYQFRARTRLKRLTSHLYLHHRCSGVIWPIAETTNFDPVTHMIPFPLLLAIMESFADGKLQQHRHRNVFPFFVQITTRWRDNVM